jgi:hypothetical protein
MRHVEEKKSPCWVRVLFAMEGYKIGVLDTCPAARNGVRSAPTTQAKGSSVEALLRVDQSAKLTTTAVSNLTIDTTIFLYTTRKTAELLSYLYITTSACSSWCVGSSHQSNKAS